MTDFQANAMESPAIDVSPAERGQGYWSRVWARLRYDYVTLTCMAVIVLVVLMAIFAPYIAPYDPNKSSIVHRLKPVFDDRYWLGTDEQGRDLLSRLIWGARVSLLTGIVPVLGATVIGGILGVLAGFHGGRINMVIMRTMDVFFAFPSVLLAVAITGSLGGGIVNQLITLTTVFVPSLCRVAETATAQVRSMDFVEAARASGAGTWSILRHQVIVNILSPLMVYASTLVSASILVASGLSFLGLGVAPPTADWGLMLSTLRGSIYINPVVCAIPGVAIVIVSMAFNLVSDGLRQAMDIKA